MFIAKAKTAISALPTPYVLSTPEKRRALRNLTLTIGGAALVAGVVGTVEQKLTHHCPDNCPEHP